MREQRYRAVAKRKKRLEELREQGCRAFAYSKKRERVEETRMQISCLK